MLPYRHSPILFRVGNPQHIDTFHAFWNGPKINCCNKSASVVASNHVSAAGANIRKQKRVRVLLRGDSRSRAAIFVFLRTSRLYTRAVHTVRSMQHVASLLTVQKAESTSGDSILLSLRPFSSVQK